MIRFQFGSFLVFSCICAPGHLPLILIVFQTILMDEHVMMGQNPPCIVLFWQFRFKGYISNLSAFWKLSRANIMDIQLVVGYLCTYGYEEGIHIFKAKEGTYPLGTLQAKEIAYRKMHRYHSSCNTRDYVLSRIIYH